MFYHGIKIQRAAERVAANRSDYSSYSSAFSAQVGIRLRPMALLWVKLYPHHLELPDRKPELQDEGLLF